VFAPKVAKAQIKPAKSPVSRTVGNPSIGPAAASVAWDFAAIPLFAGGALHRYAAGSGPATAPAIVHEVLRNPGRPMPPDVLQPVEALLGRDLADVRIHTDERAGASAAAVAAHAYTVGRHIVFAPGRFDPGSAAGKQLLAHELAHAASYPQGAPMPGGELRISRPGEPAERHAAAMADGSARPTVAPAAAPGLFRQVPGLVPLGGLSVNQRRVTVPPVGGLAFSATVRPANASSVTVSIVGDNVAIAAGTVVNRTTGAISVDAGQLGGRAHAEANQNATGPGGATMTGQWTAPFNFTAIPGAIMSTSSAAQASASFYGGNFTHTFTSPGGGQTALERSHVNEQFAGASGTTLNLTGPLGTLAITINDPNSPNAGWDLDIGGKMLGPDNVTWSNALDARPFVVNASNPTPAQVLPQDLTATQDFRNLTFPTRAYSGVAASTTHRRAIEDRNSQLKAITSAGVNQEIVQDYAGPTVFRGCTASPSTIQVAAPAVRGRRAPAPATSTITVHAEGKRANPTFTIRPPNLGCRISARGVLTPGTTPGTVTVRAGGTANFDETTVTLTPVPAATTTPVTTPPVTPPPRATGP